MFVKLCLRKSRKKLSVNRYLKIIVSYEGRRARLWGWCCFEGRCSRSDFRSDETRTLGVTCDTSPTVHQARVIEGAKNISNREMHYWHPQPNLSLQKNRHFKTKFTVLLKQQYFDTKYILQYWSTNKFVIKWTIRNCKNISLE